MDLVMAEAFCEFLSISFVLKSHNHLFHVLNMLDFSGAGFRQTGCPVQVIGRGNRVDFPAHMLDQLGTSGHAVRQVSWQNLKR